MKLTFEDNCSKIPPSFQPIFYLDCFLFTWVQGKLFWAFEWTLIEHLNELFIEHSNELLLGIRMNSYYGEFWGVSTRPMGHLIQP